MTSRKLSDLTNPLTIGAAILLIALIFYLRDAAATDGESFYVFRLLPKILAASGCAIFGGIGFLKGSKVAGACAIGVLLALFIPM